MIEWVLVALVVFVILVVLGSMKVREEESTIWKPEDEDRK